MDGADSESNSRLTASVVCLTEINKFFEDSGKTPSLAEKIALQKAGSQFEKAAAHRKERACKTTQDQTSEDISFADSFLDAFSARAFSKEMDELRKNEGETMTEADFSTLANSIRNFGLFLSSQDREAFRHSLE